MRSDKFVFLAIITLSLVAVVFSGVAYGVQDTPDIEITGGSLSIATDGLVSMPEVTLTGTDKFPTGSMSQLTSTDPRGTGTGWNVTLVSTNFVNAAAKTIASTAFSIAQPTVTTVDGNTAPTPTAVSILGGSGGKLLSATTGYGMGTYTTTGALSLAVPAETYAGTYTATITSTIADGP